MLNLMLWWAHLFNLVFEELVRIWCNVSIIWKRFIQFKIQFNSHFLFFITFEVFFVFLFSFSFIIKSNLSNSSNKISTSSNEWTVTKYTGLISYFFYLRSFSLETVLLCNWIFSLVLFLFIFNYFNISNFSKSQK